MNERIICLDIGEVRIGVAVSDPTGTIATPVDVIRRVGWGPDIRRIREICDRYETNRILSGLPLNMDGSEGFQARSIRAFCDRLTEAGFQVLFQDERLTTVAAEDVLIEGGVSRQGRKHTVDKVAASLILQQWLEEQNNHRKEQKPMADDMNLNPIPEDAENDDALEEGDLIEMIGDDGETVTFIFIDALEYENEIYLALAEQEEDDAVFFLKLEKDEDGNDIYSAPDESLEDKLFKAFMAQREAEDAESSEPEA